MKIEPIILNRIQTKHTNYVVDIQLDSNVTFITGDSGTGKISSLLFFARICLGRQQSEML